MGCPLEAVVTLFPRERSPSGSDVLVAVADTEVEPPRSSLQTSSRVGGVGGGSQPQLSRASSRASRAATAAITEAARGSAHHRPKKAVAPRPIRSATER